ncbi:hypothetical protein ARMSODRAFT_983284 [Armillaria solidipes]|uniref:Uncharacterized protein n=1 Tax=Armillaria solidipes TaxID=1076256 RepID=A0A2H3B5K0_9AGAR|nr:hypothetical protein ARMSODRAFT_983284 [Armillaria solidipes]
MKLSITCYSVDAPAPAYVSSVVQILKTDPVWLALIQWCPSCVRHKAAIIIEQYWLFQARADIYLRIAGDCQSCAVLSSSFLFPMNSAELSFVEASPISIDIRSGKGELGSWIRLYFDVAGSFIFMKPGADVVSVQMLPEREPYLMAVGLRLWNLGTSVRNSASENMACTKNIAGVPQIVERSHLARGVTKVATMVSSWFLRIALLVDRLVSRLRSDSSTLNVGFSYQMREGDAFYPIDDCYLAEIPRAAAYTLDKRLRRFRMDNINQMQDARQDDGRGKNSFVRPQIRTQNEYRYEQRKNMLGSATLLV